MPRVTIASDDFDRSDNVDLGAVWAPLINSLQVVSNRCRGTVVGDNAEQYSDVLTSADQWVQLTLTVNAGAAGFECDPWLRFTDLDNNYQCRTSDGGAGWRVRHSKAVAGIFTNLASANPAAWITGDVLRYEVEGTALRAYRNDVELLVAADPDVTAIGTGPAHVLYEESAIDRVEMDNWSVGIFVDQPTVGPFDRTRFPKFLLRAA